LIGRRVIKISLLVVTNALVMDSISIPPWVGEVALNCLTKVPYLIALYFVY